MPRIVPSVVAAVIKAMFPQIVDSPDKFPQFDVNVVPPCAAIARLCEGVPHELIVLPPEQYAGLIASIECLRALPDVFGSNRAILYTMRLHGFPRHPLALIYEAMLACRDSAPSPEADGLLFLEDESPLREALRIDLSGGYKALGNGEWKAATVLAGSVIEALLLWAVNRHQPRDREEAVARALSAATLPHPPGKRPEQWHMPQLVEVAGELSCISDGTRIEARRAKEYRNLIHPAAVERTGQPCDLGTAHVSLGAADHVIRDLSAKGPRHSHS